MISRLEIILSVVSYARKNIILYEKNLKLAKNDTFNNVFFIEFSRTTAFYQFFKNDWIFIN